MGYDSSKSTIGNLTEGKRNVSIMARVMRRWKNELAERKGLYYIDLILLDEEGATIQATINKSIQKKFDEGIEEGKSYYISRFRVAENNGSGRCSNHKCKIFFEFSTSVFSMVNNTIPMQKFNFATFKDIIDGNITPGVCVDIVGELITYHPVCDPPNGVKRTQIDLQDSNDVELSCTLWGSYVDEIINIINEFKSGQRPILLLQFVNRSEWRENVKVTTMRGATKIYVNPDIQELDELKQRGSVYSESQTSRMSAVTNDSDDILSKAKIATLEEIKSTEQPGDYVTLATIIEVDSNSGWFYNSCNKCKKKCNKNEDGLFYCSSVRGCPNAVNGVKSATPRFNVKFFVTGGQDVFAEFIMFDQQIGQLIDISASNLVERMEKDGDIDSIPTEFSEFIDKQMVVKLRVSHEFNLQSRRSYCYTVYKFSHDKMIIAKWNESYANSKAKGKEKVEDSISEGGTDDQNENDNSMQKAELSDPITIDTTEFLASPKTPCSYQTPCKRNSIEADDLCEINPIADKESRNTTTSKFKSRKIKQEK